MGDVANASERYSKLKYFIIYASYNTTAGEVLPWMLKLGEVV